jgi:hypothetical protein
MDVPNQEIIPPLPPLNSKVLPTVEGMKVPEVYPSYNTKSNVVNNVAYLVQPPSVSGGSGGDRVVIGETGGGGVSMMMPSGGAGAGDIVSAFTLHRLGSA